MFWNRERICDLEMCVAMYIHIAKDNCGMPLGSGTFKIVIKIIYDTIFLPDILLNPYRNIQRFYTKVYHDIINLTCQLIFPHVR
jgi:hypothetical protein